MNILYGILCLGFLVFFHEFGHFLAARLCGVTVESFSIGMGPVLLHKLVKGTDYRLSLIPLGGYCGMKGDKDFSLAYEQNLSRITGEKDSLYGVNAFKRIIIYFAGPFFNIFFAFIAYTIISMTGYTFYSASAKITIPEEASFSSPAREAGLKSGDIIKKINGKEINDFSDLATEVSIRPDEDITVEVLRDTEILTFSVHTGMNKSEGNGIIGVMSDPKSVEAKEAKRYSFFPALVNGAKETSSKVFMTVKSLGILFKGVDISNAVSGPARITNMLGETVKSGFSAGFRAGLTVTLDFMSLISISLFIMNLLPIPILDGGRILFDFIELIFRKQVPPKIQYKIQFIGVAFIVFLLVIALSGDIKYFVNLIKGK